MSRHIKAKAIYSLEEDAQILGHDGQLKVNPDGLKGTILCEDFDGEWYLFSFSFKNDGEWQHARSWPRKESGVIMLWRDYWSLLTLEHKSPYTESFVKVKKRLIK